MHLDTIIINMNISQFSSKRQIEIRAQLVAVKSIEHKKLQYVIERDHIVYSI